MSEGETPPGARLARNLERAYAGLAALAGWAVQALDRAATFLSGCRRVAADRVERAGGWLRRNYLWLLIPAGLVAYAAVWAYITWELPGISDRLLGRLDAEVEGGAAEDIRGLAYALAALLGALAVLATVPFQLIKTWVNERQARTAEQGHITDRLTKAVEQLGAEKTVKQRVRTINFKMPDGSETEGNEVAGEPFSLPEGATDREDGAWATFEATVPNIEVRLGAIYALERIAQDSERDYVPIIETLCAYIRNNSKPTRYNNQLKILSELFQRSTGIASITDIPDELIEKINNVKKLLPNINVDIQAALDVLKRCESLKFQRIDAKPKHRLDLAGAYLKGANLRFANLERAKLSGAVLMLADIGNAELREAELDGCVLDEAVISGSNIESTLITNAHLWNTDLMDIRGDNSNFAESHIFFPIISHTFFGERNFDGSVFHSVMILNRINFKNSILKGCSFQGCSFRNCVFDGADVTDLRFPRSDLRGAVLSGARGLRPDQISEAYGVRSGIGRTILPEGMDYPGHWLEAADAVEDGLMHWRKYGDAYRAWLASLPPAD